MADLKQLESALVKADAAGNAEDARALAAEIRRMRSLPAVAEPEAPTPGIVDNIKARFSQFGESARDLAAGGLRGAGSIGATIMAPGDMINDALKGKGLSLESNRERRHNITMALSGAGADTNSASFGVGKVGTEVMGTLGAGGAVANGVAKVAPNANLLLNAIRSGGFTTGRTLINPTVGARAADVGLRATGGATAGAAAAGLIDPESAPAGGVIGGLLPPALTAVGKVGKYGGNVVGSLLQPFTEAGRDKIAGQVLRNFAEGGPTAINNTSIVPGSVPTLAEATGNAGIATAQRAARSIRPNAFVERESQNHAARLGAFDQAAGDSSQLAAAKAARAEAGSDLYGLALDKDGSENLTPYIKGEITQLLKRPSINQASKEAQKLAMERGEKPAAKGSLAALHDVKTVIDDKINEAVRRGAGGEAKALQATKDQLVGVIEKLSPEYRAARQTYAEMSRPINAMESLQGLRLTDAKGNITLAKVKNAIEGLERQRRQAGVNAAKSITDDQLTTLNQIKADLEREAKSQLGRAAGSDTFQNLATDNILNSAAGNSLSRLLSKVGVSDVVGQGGKLIYSGANEKIRNRLVDMMLDPTSATLESLPPAKMNKLLEAALKGTHLAAPSATSR